MTASEHRPSVLLSKLLACLLGPDREAVLGDLEEEFRIRSGGPDGNRRRAQAWYRREVLRSLLPAVNHRLRGQRSARSKTFGWREAFMFGSQDPGPWEVFRLLLQEIRNAFRSLLGAPFFTLLCVAVLSFAVAAGTAVVSLVHSVLFEALPYTDPDQLAVIWEQRTQAGEDRVQLPLPDFFDLRRESESFAGLAAIGVTVEANLEGDAAIEQVNMTRVSPNLFSLLGIRPTYGFDFADPDAPADDPTSEVILSHEIWQRSFGSDQSLIGRAIQIDGGRRIVIGILPEHFQLILPASYGGRFARDPRSATDVWEPTVVDSGMGGATGHMRTLPYVRVIGRRHPQMSLEFARQEAAAFSASLRESFPEHAELGTSIEVFDMQEETLGDVRRVSIALLVLVGAVLMIACANTSGMLLTRARNRSHSLAIRVALGASRLHVLRLQLFESALLSLFSTFVGIWIGLGLHRILVSLAPSHLPGLQRSALDLETFLVLAAAIFVTTLSAGLAPALLAVRLNPNRALAGRGWVPGRSRWLSAGNLILGAQMSLVIVLLAATALMLRSTQLLGRQEYGFDLANVRSFKVSLPNAQYPGPKRGIFLSSAVDRLNALPLVTHAAAVWPLPFAGAGTQVQFAAHRSELQSLVRFAPANYRAVFGDYFGVLGVPAVQGRLFSRAEMEEGRAVAVISLSVAEKVFGKQDPAGRELWLDLGGVNQLPVQVVGTVPDLRDASARGELQPTIYLPFGAATRQRIPWIVVRTSVSAAQLAPEVREVIGNIDRRVAASDLASLSDYVATEVAPLRFSLLIIGVLAGSALLLAAGGVYGSMTALVSLQWREMGVRIALGAGRVRLIREVVGRACILALLGGLVGLVLSPLANHTLAGLLFGVGILEPALLVLVMAFLVFVSVLASLLPAARASRIDPAACLRVG